CCNVPLTLKFKGHNLGCLRGCSGTFSWVVMNISVKSCAFSVISLTFICRVIKSGNLLYGELGSIANVYPGKQGKITLEKRFENRLHLSNVTRYFTLSDLQIDDAGVYTVENTDGGKKNKFELTVYSKCCVCVCVCVCCDSSSCSVVCSVDNEKEVILTLYRGEEMLNRTSSPDLTTDPSLRLEAEGKDYNSTYSCVAANPVSNETVHSHLTLGLYLLSFICLHRFT
uniref:Ig-like domain-containing protein n=1 Tax=Hucho hucho TaxID=62062 RepID=A0A4W5RIE5_9TELE